MVWGVAVATVLPHLAQPVACLLLVRSRSTGRAIKQAGNVSTGRGLCVNALPSWRVGCLLPFDGCGVGRDRVRFAGYRLGVGRLGDVRPNVFGQGAIPHKPCGKVSQLKRGHPVDCVLDALHVLVSGVLLAVLFLGRKRDDLAI